MGGFLITGLDTANFALSSWFQSYNVALVRLKQAGPDQNRHQRHLQASPAAASPKWNVKDQAEELVDPGDRNNLMTEVGHKSLACLRLQVWQVG